MTNLRNLNQTHPFWDFVNAMQNGGNNTYNNNNGPNNGEGQQDQRDVRFAEGPWNRGPWAYPPGGYPQQSANIPVREEKPITSSSSNEKNQTNINEKDMTPETADPMDGGAPAYEDVDPPVEAPEEEEEEENSPAEEPTSAHPHRRSRHGPGHRSRSRHRQERREAKEARREQHEQNKQHRRSGFGRGGSRGGPFGFAFGGRGGHFPCGGPRGFGPGPHHHGPPPPGGPHFGGPHGSPVDLPAWASWIQSNFIDPYVGNNTSGNNNNNNNNNNSNGNRNFPFFNNNNNNNNNNDQDFTPAIDIFSTGEAFVVHVSLPGASKEDIAVNWETETSTLVVSGVIHRPGDEELLSAIEVSERQVGAFERRVVLGTRTEPAYVDQDAIGAKLQDGILRVEVPKIQREEGYVEIRKVDIQ